VGEPVRVADVNDPLPPVCFVAVYVTAPTKPAGVVNEMFAFNPVTGAATGATVSKFA
jgi:hypothetical protein